jgi:integrase
LLFLYRQMLHLDLPEIDNIERARRPKRVPVVAPAEVEAILAQLTRTHLLVVGLLYGTDMRSSECLRLRVKDLDFAYRQITMRDGKGEQD